MFVNEIYEVPCQDITQFFLLPVSFANSDGLHLLDFLLFRDHEDVQ
jgi:hypothetical protein